MKVAESVSLKRYNSFGVAATARRVIQIETLEDLAELTFDPATDRVLGGGSNLLFAADVTGTVFLNRLTGMRLRHDDGGQAEADVAAGELWHSLVLWSLAQGLSDLENLSLIPGLAGAAPMQNIGAYGVELSDTLASVQAWDWHERRLVEFSREECDFAYRSSRFKTNDRDRYLITAVRLRLSRAFIPRLEYAGLKEQLEAMGVEQPDARQVSQAVIMQRKRKLPNPALIGNAGSFFKNPLISSDQAEDLAARFPGIPVHPTPEGSAKLSAGWLIEQCGWKGHREGDAGVSDKHALVLVNHGSANGAEILALARKIARSVEETFGVALEPEPVIVGDDW